jgi:Fe-Mn family superoxide dismutase
MAFTVPDLPYAYDALEPWIDEATMRVHHDKHHAAYAANLEKALTGTDYASWPIERLIAELNSLPESIRTPVRNNGGGHYNHSLFWDILAPEAKSGAPEGPLAAAITAELGGFAAFKEDFIKAGVGRFGSGWAWLVVNKGGKLSVLSSANQDSPLSEGNIPLLGMDVWEHAYYLKYQNRRAEYAENFFKIINWKSVGARYAAAIKR